MSASDGRPDRRRMLTGAAALAAAGLLPAWARSQTPGLASGHGSGHGPQHTPTSPPELASGGTLSGERIELSIGHVPIRIGGRTGHGIGVNGTIPAPLIRLREGQTVQLAVHNGLSDEDTSIHWHGLLVPFHMDGVPGVSFPGIRPGETFVYEFPIRHAGTYWYHSHSGLQELLGHYGPLVIDPASPEPAPYDREHVLVLSDYSFMHPHRMMMKLKQKAGYFNRRKQTVAGLLAGKDQRMADRVAWAGMRMDPTDISDVTGASYTFLVNGHGPQENWTGLFQPGERVRLRIINAAAMTIFNIRIPGLAMSVVQADGLDVRPVEVDELQIANAETYDVTVTPREDRAYTFVAEAIDRSGMARATLAPRPGMTAEVPPLRDRPLLGMKDMGMSGHAGHGGGHGADHSMSMLDPNNAPQVKTGPGVQMISPMPVDRTGERGTGLADVPGRVLVYTDLVALEPNPDTRPPSRTLELHLTGNMERFMWAFDGEAFHEVTRPIPFRRDERVRVTLVNDSMMNHPIHLHGHFMELVNGHAGRHPRKHTINVQPGGKASFDLTADAPGDWAFHCHMLLHMHAGMFKVVTVRPLDGEPS
ncbi:copper resistance system multicopper oxidase [Phenylobacterium sp. SCN 70-31]|uniref:copper resistance system multicopper oxidase n=1 Tax=Phenylobacterium sp. SCN 70-31 TaxID=1660129 RepID=UPI00086F8C77|nr:copper resistance system multicopper oxidase [Phenylobacterium sp. SCN 70-31]ODT88516.1 MAG: copper-binding protein [Phenylobacterium sp. SCN 70-31]